MGEVETYIYQGDRAYNHDLFDDRSSPRIWILLYII